MRELPEGWVETTLGKHCVKIGSGSTPRGGNEAYKQEGISLIRSQNVLDFDFSYSGLAFIDDMQASKLSNVEIFEGDVLINITGDSVARVCRVPREVLPARVNQHVAILRVNKEDLDSNFLKYHLLNPIFKRYLLILANSGGTRNALTKNMLELLSLNLPSLQEQKAIATILSSFDEKIELLRAQNETLETLAQTIFKEWFVNFNYPGATGEMVDSELGEIPKGWRVYELKELVRQIKPGTNYQPKRIEKGIPFVNGRHVKNGFLDLSDVKYITFDEYERVHKVWKPEENDVLITRIGTLGNVGVVRECDLPMALHYNSIDIKEDRIRYQFLYFLLKSDNFQEQYHLNKKQAVQEFITIEAVEKINIVLPIDLKNLEILKIFDGLFEKIKNNTSQFQTLAKTRDTLLPKLMRGEKRVEGFDQ